MEEHHHEVDDGADYGNSLKEGGSLKEDVRKMRPRKTQVSFRCIRDGGRCSRRTALMVAALVCFLIVITAVVAGVVLGGRNDPTQAPTLSPTDLSTLDNNSNLTASERYQVMVNAIGNNVSSDPAVFQSTSSVQYAAMNWLANTYGASDTRILVERYAMAVFYYATDGPSWLVRYNFLDPTTSECQWNEPGATPPNGVSCSDDQFVSSISLCK